MPTEDPKLPSTLRRSPQKVQRTYERTLDSAEEEYSSEARAHRTAWAAVKHVAEKTGDHWELKDEAGPSDAQAGQGGEQAREHPKPTAGGVDVNGHTKAELMDRARDLDVPGRSGMDKQGLGEAIAKRQ